MTADRIKTVLLLATASLVITSEAFSKDPVSRTPPEDWKRFEQQLISVEDAQKLPESSRDTEDFQAPLEYLARHRYYWVNPDGSSLTVYHDIRRLLDDSQTEDFSTDYYSFSPVKDRIHVVVARTITEGGEVVEAPDEGIFAEQRENQSNSLFTDNRRVRIVFPKVTQGAVTESIVVVESSPWMEGHWTRINLWNAFFPVRSSSIVVECDSGTSERITWDARKLGLQPKEKKISGGDYRFHWSEESVPTIPFETAMPNLYQRGPFLRIGFEASWESFGEWFAGLVETASSDSESLKQVAIDWAGDAEEPWEIASNLFAKVSQDIRYTGLEFGKGAFQPRGPGKVIETAYGDCKDKSNLLRVLLDHHGIESKMVLINTKLPGDVPKAIPSTGVFDHAILAVKIPGKKEWVFCDPTMDGMPFGGVASRDESKEVLLVGTDGAIEWSKTPSESDHAVLMRADLELDPSGAYSGWIELEAHGSLGWLYRRHFERMENRSDRMQAAISSFFRFSRGIRLADGAPVETGKAKGDAPPFHYRFYALQSPLTSGESGKTSRLHLPVLNQVMTPVGKAGVRRLPFVSVEADVEYDISISLPEGWSVIDSPGELQEKGYGYEISASVEEKSENQISGHVRMNRFKREYSPRQFGALAESVRDMAQWLDTPVLLSRADDEGASEGFSFDPEELPKMPTSEGHAVFINTLYPLDPMDPYSADHEARLVAFENMRDLFAKDNHLAQFTSRIMADTSRLFIGIDQDEAARIAKRMTKVAERYKGKVESEQTAAAELLVLGALVESGANEASIELAESLLARESLPSIIEMSAAGVLCSLIAEEKPERALELARIAIPNQLIADMEWSAIAVVMLDCVARVSPESLGAEIQQLFDTYPDRSE
ncbi:MAG: DUF3857 domain-containing transglutaminase family protein, partial [Verrucomicrobiales bacterium]|nr:DUF3857 domain-containing transglutaminase family protein [Verrucomicrobiales bacterium]